MTAWQLLIGGEDVTAFIPNGATFTEVASSALGGANFHLRGPHPGLTIGAGVQLLRGTTMWEGYVTKFYPLLDALGAVSGNSVQCASAAGALAVQNPLSLLAPTDVAVVAGLLLPATVPWGGPATLGINVTSLTFSEVASGLTALSLIAGKAWRVQGGKVIFVDFSSGVTQLAATASGASNPAGSVYIVGGLDAGARQALAQTYTSSSFSGGPAYAYNAPETTDQSVLDQIGDALIARYSTNNFYGTITAPAGSTNRAGDWIQDQAGIIAPITQTQYTLSGGDLTCLYTIGYPPLPTAPTIVPAQVNRNLTQPPTRVSGDFLQSGGQVSIVGTTASLAAGTIVLGNVSYSLSAANLTMPTNGTVQINATSTAFIVALVGTPAPTTAVPMYLVTMSNGLPVGTLPLYSVGGVAANNLVANSVTSVAIAPSAVLGANIAPASVLPYHLKSTRYSTNLVNTAGPSPSASYFWDATNSKYIDIGAITGVWAQPTSTVTGAAGPLGRNYTIYAVSANGYGIASPLVYAGSPGTPNNSLSGAAFSYFGVATYVTAQGESLPNAEFSGINAGSVVGLVSPVPQNVIGWNIYTSPTTGTEKKANGSPIAVGSTFTVSSYGAGVAPPVADTSGITIFDATHYATLNWAAVTGTTNYLVWDNTNNVGRYYGTALTMQDKNQTVGNSIPLLSINNSTIVWDCGAASDAGVAVPYQGTLFLFPNDTVNIIFRHVRYGVSTYGNNRIYFTAKPTSGSNVQSVNTFKDTSSASKSTVVSNPGTGGTGSGGGSGGGGGRIIF